MTLQDNTRAVGCQAMATTLRDCRLEPQGCGLGVYCSRGWKPVRFRPHAIYFTFGTSLRTTFTGVLVEERHLVLPKDPQHSYWGM